MENKEAFKPVVMAGVSNLGKIALEICQSNDRLVLCFLDDREELLNSEIGLVSVLGTLKDRKFVRMIGHDSEVFVSIEDKKERMSYISYIKEKRSTMPTNLFHKNSTISLNSHLGHGILANAGAIINSESKVGNYCVLHSNALVDFAAQLGENVVLGPGAIVCTSAQIGDGASIGAGAIVASGVKVGKNAVVMPGSVVLREVKAGQAVYGNPAQLVNIDKKKKEEEEEEDDFEEDID